MFNLPLLDPRQILFTFRHDICVNVSKPSNHISLSYLMNNDLSMKYFTEHKTRHVEHKELAVCFNNKTTNQNYENKTSHLHGRSL